MQQANFYFHPITTISVIRSGNFKTAPPPIHITRILNTLTIQSNALLHGCRNRGQWGNPPPPQYFANPKYFELRITTYKSVYSHKAKN